MKLDVNLKYEQSSDSDFEFNKLNIRVDNPIVTSVSPTVTFPENNSSVPKIINGEIVDDVSDHIIEYEVIFNQPTDYYEFNVDIINDSLLIDAERELLERFITIGDGEEKKFKYLSDLYEFFDYSYQATPSWRFDYIVRGDSETINVRLKLKENITDEQFNSIKGKVIKIKYHLKYHVGHGMHNL